MKYKIMLLVLACALVMSSCNKVDEKAITGDVKDTQSEVFEVDQVQQEEKDEKDEKDEKIVLPEEIVVKPEEEIAQKLGVPLGTVKSRLSSAKAHFKEKYPYHPKQKGETDMKTLPEILPEFKIKKIDKMIEADLL